MFKNHTLVHFPSTNTNIKNARETSSLVCFNFSELTIKVYFKNVSIQLGFTKEEHVYFT